MTKKPDAKPTKLQRAARAVALTGMAVAPVLGTVLLAVSFDKPKIPAVFGD